MAITISQRVATYPSGCPARHVLSRAITPVCKFFANVLTIKNSRQKDVDNIIVLGFRPFGCPHPQQRLIIVFPSFTEQHLHEPHNSQGFVVATKRPPILPMEGTLFCPHPRLSQLFPESVWFGSWSYLRYGAVFI